MAQPTVSSASSGPARCSGWDAVKVSALLNAVNDAIAGRLLVFFPGQHEGNSYRLLDARDGWNYLAIPITPNGSGR